MEKYKLEKIKKAPDCVTKWNTNSTYFDHFGTKKKE